MHSIARPALALLALSPLVASVGACFSGGDAHIKLTKGDKTEELDLGVTDPLTGDAMTPLATGDGLSLPYSYNGHSDILDSDQPTVTLLPSTLSVGLVPGLLSFDHLGTAIAPLTFSYYVDSIHFTGDGAHPFELRGHAGDAQAEDRSGIKVEALDFHAVATCEALLSDQSVLCGFSVLRSDYPPYTVSLPAAQGDCAPEIAKAVVGGDGAVAHVDINGSVTVDGASIPMACTHLLGDNDLRSCGGENELDAGGCHWKVFAEAYPSFDPSDQSAHVLVNFGATTDDDKCAAASFCNGSTNGISQDGSKT